MSLVSLERRLVVGTGNERLILQSFHEFTYFEYKMRVGVIMLATLSSMINHNVLRKILFLPTSLVLYYTLVLKDAYLDIRHASSLAAQHKLTN
jgi:hypothetical protein